MKIKPWMFLAAGLAVFSFWYTRERKINGVKVKELMIQKQNLYVDP